MRIKLMLVLAAELFIVFLPPVWFFNVWSRGDPAADRELTPERAKAALVTMLQATSKSEREFVGLKNSATEIADAHIFLHDESWCHIGDFDVRLKAAKYFIYCGAKTSMYYTGSFFWEDSVWKATPPCPIVNYVRRVPPPPEPPKP